MPSFFCSALISKRISSRRLASRLLSGSSSSSRRGSETSARASATRCCWPPESCEGSRSSRPARPTCAIAARVRSRRSGGLDAGQLQRVGDVVEDAHVRPDRVVLEHDAEPRSFGGTTLPGRGVGDALVADANRAGIGRLEAGDQPQQHGLAAAGRAEQREALAVDQLEVEPRQHGLRAVALLEPAMPTSAMRRAGGPLQPRRTAPDAHFCMMSVNFLIVASFSAMICW